MTSSDRRPIHLLSWIYTLFIVLPAVCQAQPTNSPPNEGFTGFYKFNKSTTAMVIVFSFLIFVTITLSYYIYRLCCYERVNRSIPIQNYDANRGRGLDHDTIETFPILLYSAVKNIKIGSESMECAICLNEFEDDDTLRFIPICHHVFHPNCIDSWLSSHITCPVCRANLTEQELPKTNPGNSQSELIETNAPIDQIVIGTASEDQNVVLPSRPKRVHGRFSKSHSTGHSMVLSHSMGHAMVLPGETTERYTLRLPEDVRRQILMANAKLKRVRSMNLLLDTEGSSRKGRRWNAGDEGSGTGARLKSLQIERPKKWVFCATPPFVTRGGGSARIARLGNEREGSANGGSVGNATFGNDEERSVNGKTTLLASIKTPNFLSKRSDGIESSSSARLSV